MTATPPLLAVIFDLDGVLLDTERLYMQATERSLLALHVRPEPGALEELVGLSDEDCKATLIAILGDGGLWSRYDRLYRRHRDALLRKGTPVKPGAAVAIAASAAVGAKIGIASNASRSTIRTHLPAIPSRGKFDCIVAREDVVRPKPAPDLFHEAARRLAVEPECCLALEDSDHGIRAAAAAGVRVLGVKDVAPIDSRLVRHCEQIVGSLHEAARVILMEGRAGAAQATA